MTTCSWENRAFILDDTALSRHPEHPEHPDHPEHPHVPDAGTTVTLLGMAFGATRLYSSPHLVGNRRRKSPCSACATRQGCFQDRFCLALSGLALSTSLSRLKANAFFHQASSSVSSSDPCPLAPFAHSRELAGQCLRRRRVKGVYSMWRLGRVKNCKVQ